MRVERQRRDQEAYVLQLVVTANANADTGEDSEGCNGAVGREEGRQKSR